MGRTYKLAYHIEYMDNIHSTSAWAIWNSKTYGKPTHGNLEKWRKAMNESFKPGQSNAHVSQSAGVMEHIISAKVIRQSNHSVMAETTMPRFEEI